MCMMLVASHPRTRYYHLDLYGSVSIIIACKPFLKIWLGCNRDFYYAFMT